MGRAERVERTSVAELGGRTVNYGYDALYRLTNETISGASTPQQNGSISYGYDAVGNRLSRTSTLPTIPSQQNIVYDDNDRLSTDGYDDNGNTVTSNGKTYTYDFKNRIIAVTGNGTDISIVYNGNGDRVSKTVNGITTNYLVDTNNLTGYSQVVEELQNGSVVCQYTYGLDLISQRQLINGEWTTHYYGYDGHGSVRFLADASGTITNEYTYDAFGNIIASNGNTPNVYLYAGEQYDADLGLYYNRARYLSTGTGRFWSQDEFEGVRFDPKSLHKYLYAHADPVNKIDPSGRNRALIDQQSSLLIASIVAAISLIGACAFQFAITSAAADFADFDTTTVPGPCVNRRRSEHKRAFFRGTTFYDAAETVETQHINIERIIGNQSNFGFNPDRFGVYFTSQLSTAMYYANLVGGQGRGAGPGIVIAEVSTRRFSQFAIKYGIAVETPVPNPPQPGQTETLIPFHAMPEFESFAKYRY
jgi:RHS repeat-associated protein